MIFAHICHIFPGVLLFDFGVAKNLRTIIPPAPAWGETLPGLAEWEAPWCL